MDSQPETSEHVQLLTYLQQQMQEEQEGLKRQVQTLEQKVKSLQDLYSKLDADICKRQQKRLKTASERIAIHMLNRTCDLVEEEKRRLVVALTQTKQLVR